MNNKALTVLRLLLKGAIIQDSMGRRWTMTDKHDVGILAVKEKSSEEVVLICDFTLTGFIGWAESLSDDAVFIAGANVALNELKVEGRAK